MNPILNTSLIISLSLWILTLHAQESKYSLQIMHGIAITSHHRIEAPFDHGFVVYVADSKKEKLAFQMDFSIYRRLNKYNEVFVGLGYAEYRFYQMGQSYSDDAVGGPPVYYSKNYSLHYFNLSSGHKFKYDRGQSIIPYMENSIYGEKIFNSDLYGNLYYFGISLKSKLGMAYSLNHKASLSLGIIYKSAIYSYGGIVLEEYAKKYQFMPYAYGFEFGLSTKM